MKTQSPAPVARVFPRHRRRNCLALIGACLMAAVLQGCSAFCLPVYQPSTRGDPIGTLFYDRYVIINVLKQYESPYTHRLNEISDILIRQWNGHYFESPQDLVRFVERYHLKCDPDFGPYIPSLTGTPTPIRDHAESVCTYTAYREDDFLRYFPQCGYLEITTAFGIRRDLQGRYVITSVRPDRSPVILPRGTRLGAPG